MDCPVVTLKCDVWTQPDRVRAGLRKVEVEPHAGSAEICGVGVGKVGAKAAVAERFSGWLPSENGPNSLHDLEVAPVLIDKRCVARLEQSAGIVAVQESCARL